MLIEITASSTPMPTSIRGAAPCPKSKISALWLRMASANPAKPMSMKPTSAPDVRSYRRSDLNVQPTNSTVVNVQPPKITVVTAGSMYSVDHE